MHLNACSKKSFYLINPGGDLKKSEERFEQNIHLEKLQGIKGVAPDRAKFLEIWENNDFYLSVTFSTFLDFIESILVILVMEVVQGTFIQQLLKKLFVTLWLF